ncbi:MAG: hypothetical protein ABII23_00690 [bacterium]
MKNIRLYVLSAFLLLGSITGISFAEGIKISTGSILLSGKAGDVFKGSFTVTSAEDNLREVTLEKNVKTWFLLEENKDIRQDSWIRVVPEKLVLKAGDERIVTYNVSVPPDAAGFLMAMITFEVLPEEKEKKAAAEKRGSVDEEDIGEGLSGDGLLLPQQSEQISAENGDDLKEEEILFIYNLPVYLLVIGKTSLTYEISDITLENTTDNFNMNFKVENTGNVFIKPEEILIQVEELEEPESGKKCGYLLCSTPNCLSFPGICLNIKAAGNDWN